MLSGGKSCASAGMATSKRKAEPPLPMSKNTPLFGAKKKKKKKTFKEKGDRKKKTQGTQTLARWERKENRKKEKTV